MFTACCEHIIHCPLCQHYNELDGCIFYKKISNHHFLHILSAGLFHRFTPFTEMHLQNKKKKAKPPLKKRVLLG